MAATYTPPSTAVSKINSYRSYSELTKAAGSMDIDQYAYNMTTWQISNGGFYKAMADKYKNPYSSGNKSEWRSSTGEDLATIDNDATIQEMRLLAVRYKETSNATYKSAFQSSFNKAVNFLLTMQRSTGGLPQVWPKRGNYSDHITLNDNAMVRAMVAMMDIANGTSPFDSDIIDNDTRSKMQAALEKAIDYLIRAQIVNNGTPTVWCAQHDTANYAPRPARAYELESKSGSESAGVVWFLMNWSKQTPAVQNAVKSAINWYKKTKVTGLYFNMNAGTFEQKDGNVLWYRFYEVNSDEYFFCDRDGASTKTQDFTQISEERRTGYQWAGNYGTALLSAESDYLAAISGISIPEEYGPNAGSGNANGNSDSTETTIPVAEKKAFDFVVGVDGDFKAAMEAAAAANPTERDRFIIFFPDGEYDIGAATGDTNQMTEFKTSYVSFIGQSAEKTILYNKSIDEGISKTATLYLHSSGIYMQDMTILNKAIYGNEANCGSACRHVAIMQQGDKFIYKNVKLLSGQDTYYTKKSGGSRTYWDGGHIEGTVDFICGDGDIYFDRTELVMRRNKGYLTAAATTTQWGYVFDGAVISTSDASFNNTFYLGRSWKTAKTVFLNSTMQALPNAEGWGPNMNSAPQVFGEYNSKDGNGNAVNTSQRKTDFDGTYLETVWSENDAKDYTLANVLGGTDSWAPEKYSAQVKAPIVALDTATKTISWNADDAALCWAVFKNGSFETFTTENKYTFNALTDEDVITVRAANSMGGLGQAATAVTAAPTSVKDSTIAGTDSSSISKDSSVTEKDSTATAMDSSTVSKDSTIAGTDSPSTEAHSQDSEPSLIPTISKSNFQYDASTKARLFTVNGKLLRESMGAPVSTHGLNRGIYLLQIENGSIRKQQLIQVR